MRQWHQEIKTNIFLRCGDPKIKYTLGLNDSSEVEVFSKLRDLKDNFQFIELDYKKNYNYIAANKK